MDCIEQRADRAQAGRFRYGNAVMEPMLIWLDSTASDRDRMRRVLDLFKEQGTVDEMGLGSLRDILSDALFPGASYIRTRLRYVLFIPWITAVPTKSEQSTITYCF